MARIIEGTSYEVEAGTVECAGDLSFDAYDHAGNLVAMERPCDVWDWFESAEGTRDWWGVVTWECPECGTLNEFEIGD